MRVGAQSVQGIHGRNTLLVETLRAHNDEDGGRHHSGETYRAESDRAGNLAASGAVRLCESVDGVGWDQPAGRILTPFADPSTYEAPPREDAPSPRVLQITRYDPGSAAYRYHSAANSVEHPGVSVFVRYQHSNPHCDLRQFDGERHARAVRDILMHEADVVIAHMDYSVFEDAAFVGAWPRRGQMLVRHYHGSHPNPFAPGVDSLFQFALDESKDAVLIGARLYHNRFHPRMHWVPIPVPVADYQALRARVFVPREDRQNGCWRIAHSPTNPSVKGSIALECAVQDLRAKGVPVELVMIRGKSHGEALAIKATCDITFDSFWLGIQGSGLEAAAMGQAVVAGDPEVKAEYEAFLGECPYTYARDFSDVGGVLLRLIEDADYRAEEADRVHRYTVAHHDYPAVGRTFWGVIDEEMARRGMGTLAHA